jgi:hypothetical protein
VKGAAARSIASGIFATAYTGIKQALNAFDTKV